jgi:hypothetical protein
VGQQLDGGPEKIAVDSEVFRMHKVRKYC